jgi:predicted Zn-dependent protease
MNCIVRVGVLAIALASVPVYAQFNFNLNKLTETVKKVAEATKDMTEAEEIEHGEGVTAVLLGASPLYADDNLQRYVNRVGRWIASQSARPDLPWNFAVIDTPTVNAFAAPGGKVLVSIGLIRKLKSESELAGALAHEVAHVTLKHQVQAIQAARRSGVLQDVAQDEANRRIANTSAGSNALTGQLASAGASMGIEAVKNGVFLRPLDRGLEYDADRLGVVLAARAGYDPYGLVAVIQTLSSLKPDETGVSLLMSTHPTPNDRLNELEKYAATLDRFASQPQVEGRFAQMISAVK